MESLKTKVACYYRFSRDGQSNYSIEAQQRACRAFCETHDYEIVREYKDEGCSASKNVSKREEFLEMIDDAKKKKFEKIVVHKIDRFSRGDDYETAFYKHLLKQSGVKRESVTEQGIDDSPEGEVMEKMLELIAHYFSRNLSREAKKGQYENALKGKHNGGPTPLGYSVNQQGDYILNEAEAEIVKKIYEMFLKGYGYDKIAQAFPEFRTKRNKPLGKGSIHDILKNEKYTGVYIYNQSWIKGANGKMSNRIKKPLDEQIRIEGGMPVIIDRATWLKVQEKMQERKKISGSFKSNNHIYLLSNLLKCGECGSKLSGTVCRKKGIYEIFYYECGRYKRYKDCNIKKVRADKLETIVIDYLKEYFTKINFNNLTKWIDANKNEILRQKKDDLLLFKNNLKSVQTKLESAVNLLIDCPSSTLKEKVIELEKEKVNLENIIKGLKTEKTEISNMGSLKSFIKDIEQIDNLEREKQKRLIETFIASIIIYKENENFEIKISSNLTRLLDLPDDIACQGDNGSPKGNRTPDTAVKGRCLNLLTMGPFSFVTKW